MNKRKAVFLDRDGTINEDPGYLGDPSKLVLLPTVGESLAILKNEYKFLLIVISNQSGVSRGLISEENVIEVNKAINKQLSSFDVQIDEFMYCTFHPEFSTKNEVNCRKPLPHMVLEAVKKFNIDLPNSYFIGDSVSDIECAENSGTKSILVQTGNGLDSISVLQKQNKFPTFVAVNLKQACNFIIKDSSGVNS